MEYKDYYKVLGVERNATPVQIKAAYRKLAMKHHPDRNQGSKTSEDKFKEINEANEVLSDSEKRSRYDQLGEAYFSSQQPGTNGNFRWDDWVAQSQGGGRRGEVGNLDELFGAAGFSDFFNAIFGGMGGTTAQQTQRRQTTTRQPLYETPVTITFQEAFSGAKRMVEVDGRRLEVKIPAGAKDGTKVRIPGAVQGRLGGKEDVYLLISVAQDARFERKGKNLHTEAVVDLYTAVLGGNVKVITPGGDVMFTIPEGTQPGQAFRLTGRGMPDLRDPKLPGDLLVKIKVNLPKALSSEQRSQFEKLRKNLGGEGAKG
jgi:curved DNA-binding protein